MPQINEYLPETEGSNPAGPISPNLEASSIFGRGLESAGQTIEQGADLVYRREAQQEISQVASKVTAAKVNWNQELQNRINTGTLDVDQFKQDYQDNMDEIGGNLQTAAGKDYFTRYSSRVGGMLLQHAVVGQGQIAGVQAQQSAQTYINGAVATLNQNPAGFSNEHESYQEYLDAQLQSGALKPQQLAGVKKYGEAQLVKGAIQGYIKNSPGDADLGQDGAAKQMLDQGAFDNYLDANGKQQMYALANQGERAGSAGRKQQEKLADNTYNQQYEMLGGQWLKQIQSDQLSPKTVLNSPLQEKDKEHFLNMINQHARGEEPTDPRTYNQLAGQIAQGQITDMSQLMPKVANGTINAKDAEKLNGVMKMVAQSPTSIISQQNSLLAEGKRSIITQSFDHTTTPLSESKYKEFHDHVIQSVQDAVQQGKDPKDLFNPHIKGNLYDQMGSYKTSAFDTAATNANSIATPQLVPPAPGLQVPATPTKLPKNARNPGESQGAYLKRMGL